MEPGLEPEFDWVVLLLVGRFDEDFVGENDRSGI
jgi:hypothetical protein